MGKSKLFVNGREFKPIKNKNSYVGRSYRVNDNDLPHNNADSNKVVNLLVVEENGKRVGGVRGTTQKTPNAHSFHSKHPLYKGVRTFLETEFNDGTPIMADDKRLKENQWDNNLSVENLHEIKDVLYRKSKQAKENRAKRNKLLHGNKKSRS